MSVKTIQVVAPGGEIEAHVAVTPETTAGDVIKEVGLNERYFLSPSSGDKFFQPDDRLDPLVRHGELLFANPWADVGSDAGTPPQGGH